ncbi:homoserine O-succinyltransferase MetA [Methylobacterium nonmethylotrophicum]|uniref:Homoserine O-succinyltransferase n=1 Tax=Methylobacterium nonmethylotrophicum TaxID=1141884 RepID=A0A4Z0NQX3_9HYPH|nr:homoserine O-succinyltransferase [Methylobacterium nonmethylotrophicum]TGD99414.1 homoserine O-succinyltransferase [Methylobacterium nonmethylotrophicum]
MLEHGPSPHMSALEMPGWSVVPRPPSREDAAPPLRVGLLNNMPDAAFIRTEAQFRQLLGPDAALARFAFLATPRAPAVAARIAAHYAPHEALAEAGLDALVVTGCEPRQARLEDEPFFAPLAAVIDWAAESTVSTLFSCLASHAAVLHRDGIRRQPLTRKHSGVFACDRTAPHPLLAGEPDTVPVPHSRWNDLAEDDLTACGYTVLRRSAEVGVDLFVREGRSLLVFLQGHPEYEPDSLAREYRRDLGRFLDGTAATCPGLPRHYYTAAGEARLADFAAKARSWREFAQVCGVPGLDAAPLRPAAWQPAARRLFANWLACVADRRCLARQAAR